MQKNNKVTDVAYGCFIMEIEQHGRIRQIDSGFTEITGYTQEDVEEGIFFPQLVCEEDWKELFKKLKIRFKKDHYGCFNYRVKRKDGNIFCALFCGERTGNEIRGIMTDLRQNPGVDDQIKEINEQWQKRLEPYQIVERAAKEIYFSYSVSEDVLTLPSDYASYMGISEKMSPFLNSPVGNLPICPEDMTNLLHILRSACRKPMKGFHEYRLQKNSSHGERAYSWRRMYYISLADSKGNVQRILGRITDVDREKQANEELRRKARMDPLTGLLNKTVTQHLIRDCFRHSPPEKHHGLMMIDLDHFKKINDYYGHLYGDQVLREVSRKIRSIFRKTDILGRVGGDEFMVLMKNAGQEMTVKKAAELCRSIEKDYRMGEKNIRVSCSIGIAIFGEHGKDYDSLYAKADMAMYQAKTLGRNHYMVYAGGDEAEEVQDAWPVDLDRADSQVLLLADDNEERSRQLEKVLCGNFTVQRVRKIKDVSSVFQTFSAGFSGILLAEKLEGQDWQSIIQRVRREIQKANVPVFLIAERPPTTWDNIEDIIFPPYGEELVCKRIQNVVELYEQRREFRQWFINQNHQIEGHEHRLADSQAMLLHALSALSVDRQENNGHAGRVSQYTKIILEQVMIERPDYGFTHTDVEIISAAATIQKIGESVVRIFVQNRIQEDSKSESNPMERIEDSPFYHYCMDFSIPFNSGWSGKHFSSEANSREEIPLGIQAAGMAEIYDRLTQREIDGRVLSHNEAVKGIIKGKYGCFSPFLIFCFRKVAPQLPYCDL